MIARVEPLTPARRLRGPFDYRLPGHLAGVGAGDMLVVPFGGRRLLAVVVEVAETSEIPGDRLVEPLAALEHGVPAELVALGLWVGEEYCSTPARGLSLVLPPGTGTGRRRPVGARRTLGAAATDAGRAALAGGTRLGSAQRAALAALAEGPAPAAELVRRGICSHATLRALEGRGLLTLQEVERARRPVLRPVGARGRPERLTREQEGALAAVLATMDGPPGIDRRLLLHGVTGSGKTEVYLRAAAAALERGRSAIVLVPEIALTPQTAGRFEQRFGDRVAVMHSRLSPGERYDEWVRLRRGEARVCVGPRSAVFAPVADLGLIVVDEEHDGSYKQDGDPRYDARRVAERRAEGSGAVLLAGSATPRPESFAGLRRLVMARRVDGRDLPPVEIVAGTGFSGPLHPRSRRALQEVAERGEKAVVLLNRRGWSNFLSCRVCGRAWECPDCDVTLVLHRARARMACHHCGHGEAVPRACPDCGSVSLARHGAGTERLEEELAELVAPLPVLRLDADAAPGGAGVGELLRRFDAAPAGVLVGTQMVAKGHDFPDVTLGLVLDADGVLRFPDFRAEERAFALVAQLAGRSGRGRAGGRVIVQALDPEARALRHAAGHDAAGFLAGELERRRLLSYPPYGHLIRVVCASPDPGPEQAAAAAVRDALEGWRERGGAERRTVLGPAPLFRLKGRERSQLVIKAPAVPGGRALAVAAVRGAVEATAAARAHRRVLFSVDVDPQ